MIRAFELAARQLGDPRLRGIIWGSLALSLALQVGIAVAAVPSRAPTSPRQEPDLLIVPDSRDVTLRSFGKSADRQE